VETFTTVLELAGIALAVLGLFILAAWLGFIAAGVALFAIGWVFAPDPHRGRRR
jgi:hypothetical protein